MNEKIEKVRKQHKLSREGLSKLSNFKARTIASYERGERPIPKEYILFLSLYFNVEEEYFSNDSYKENGMTVQRLTIERYKYIYQCTDNEILEKINCQDINEYFNNLNDVGKSSKLLSFLVILSNKLYIKPSSLGFTINDNTIVYRRQLINPIMYDANLDILFDNETNDKFISITTEYFLAVVKKRNDPKHIFIPNNQNETINIEFQEVLELLKYTPKDFVSKLLIQLRRFKTEQESFFE